MPSPLAITASTASLLEVKLLLTDSPYYGEQNYPHVRHQVFQDRCRHDAICPRHRQIQENQIGLEFAGFFDSIFTINGFATNIKMSLDKI